MKTYNNLKRLIVIILCFVTASISFIGCFGQTETFVTFPALLEDEIEFDNLITGKISESYYTAGLIRNKSNKLYDFHVDFLYYNLGNRLLGVDQTLIQGLYPGMEKSFFKLTAEGWPKASKIEARVVNIVKASKSSITPNFKFDNLSVYHHEFGTNIFGEVTNLDEMQYSIIVLVVVFDKNGNPVEANVHQIDNLYSGETRMFSVPLINKTKEDNCQVYLDSIVSAVPAQKQANITFSNETINYNSDVDRSSLIFDIVNNDSYKYQMINLVFGLYDQGKLLNVIENYVRDMGPGETVHFDQMLLNGDWTGKELKISINNLII